MNKNHLIYSRLSQSYKDPFTGKRDIENVAWQEVEATRWIEAAGDHVAGIIRENSQGAYLVWKRPKFNEVLRQAEARETPDVHGIVSYAMDRLTRHPKEMEKLIDLAEEFGFIAKTMDGYFDLTTEQGRMQARGAVNAARFEVEKKSKRHRDGNQRRLDAGRPPQGGGRPFGFEPDKVTIRQAEADQIKDVTERFLAGAHLRALVREWNGEKMILTSRGGMWNRHTMSDLLQRWRNAGLREHTSDGKYGIPVQTVLADAVWPEIVSRDQVEAVRHLLAARRSGPMLITRKHLLSGIARCGKCGQPMKADATVLNGTRYPVYRCRGGYAELTCSLSVRQDVVDEKVMERATSILALPSPALVNVEGTKRATDLRAERAMIKQQMQALRARDFSVEFEAILADASGFQSRVEAIDGELARLSDNDALAELVAELIPLTREDVAKFTVPSRALVRARLDALQESDLGKLRRVLRRLVTVELLPWEGTGKPNAHTARQRVRVTEIDPEEFVTVA